MMSDNANCKIDIYFDTTIREKRERGNINQWPVVKTYNTDILVFCSDLGHKIISS